MKMPNPNHLEADIKALEEELNKKKKVHESLKWLENFSRWGVDGDRIELEFTQNPDESYDITCVWNQHTDKVFRQPLQASRPFIRALSKSSMMTIESPVVIHSADSRVKTMDTDRHISRFTLGESFHETFLKAFLGADYSYYEQLCLQEMLPAKPASARMKKV